MKIKKEIRGKRKGGPVTLLSQLVKNSEGSTKLYLAAQVRHVPRIQNMVEPCMTVRYVCFQQRKVDNSHYFLLSVSTMTTFNGYSNLT